MIRRRACRDDDDVRADDITYDATAMPPARRCSRRDAGIIGYDAEDAADEMMLRHYADERAPVAMSRHTPSAMICRAERHAER